MPLCCLNFAEKSWLNDLFHQSHLRLTIISFKLYGWALFSKCFVSGYDISDSYPLYLISNFSCLTSCVPFLGCTWKWRTYWLTCMRWNRVMVCLFLTSKIGNLTVSHQFQRKSRWYPKSTIRIELASLMTNNMHMTKLVISFEILLNMSYFWVSKTLSM